MELTHLDGEGKAVMVDVSHKPRVRRTARAKGRVFLKPATLRLVREKLIKKGDVLTVAQIAGISAAKKTAELIPLCRNIAIDLVEVNLSLSDEGVEIESRAVCTDKTGIEMEALTAVSVAALTVYDMCKAVDKGMRIEAVRLIEKTKEEA